MDDNWYAIYTKRHYEKKLCDAVSLLSIETGFVVETYLPMTEEVVQWSDRKKVQRKPLFNNYIFVKHDNSGFDKLKRMPGFFDYVRTAKYPSVIPDEQIQMIKNAIESDKNVVSLSRKIMKGQRVRICDGPLSGYEGCLVENQSSSNVAIEVKNINQCLLVNVAIENIVEI